MLVENVSVDAVNEAFVLLSAYVREEGKVIPSYNMERLKEAVNFLHDILKNPANFVVHKEETHKEDVQSG